MDISEPNPNEQVVKLGLESKWWKVHLVVRDYDCLMAGEGACYGDRQGAHIISQHHLKKRHRGDRLWDLRNGMLLCERHHNRHDRHLQRVPREKLPKGISDFCEELGISYLLDKYYPKGG